MHEPSHLERNETPHETSMVGEKRDNVMADSASGKQRVAKQAEKVLKESERVFRAVWEYASTAMALSAPDGTVIAANPAYFRLYGFPSEEVIGKHFSIIFPQEQRT